MEALVLCGGFATRLEPITLFVPKPLLPIGGRPIIDYTLDKIHEIGVEKIIFSTNLKFADQFEYWIEHKKNSGAGGNIHLIVEPTMHDGEKLGAIKGINYTIEKAAIEDDLLIVAGDNFYNFKLKKVLDHFNKGRKPTVALYDLKSKKDAKRFGVVSVKDNILTGFEEKPERPKSTVVSTGIYLFPREMLGKFSEYVKDGNNPDAPGYFLQWLIKNDEIHGVIYDENWFDIGTIDTYKKVFDQYMKKG
ncbi:MAG: nucleotidyltransferase family protein [Candidatus Micrarchaeota archaeon]|nr:nucleotidyltransferase family protein [Candidatus Micrarchaeota archaeon]MDE1850153.1 nucleotidyltransferase family protein [Candidatus Micrarchaeota archaeon]